jgi:hypothetical protein
MTETDNTALERLILFLVGAGLGALGALVTTSKAPGNHPCVPLDTEQDDRRVVP